MKIFSPTKFIQSLIYDKFNGEILSGPFKELKFQNKHVAAAGIPTILGTYEKEIHSFFTINFLKKYKNFIDIGAGEGYYLAGVLKNNPHIKGIAFEQNINGLNLIKENIALNGFKNEVLLYGKAAINLVKKVLVDIINQPTLILVDIEGFEETLLNPEEIEELLNVDLIVEVHEHFIPGLEKLMENRFSKTHSITKVTSQERNINDLPIKLPLVIKLIFKKYIIHLMGEGRAKKMNWFIMQKK
jgi:hypothetical protein